MNRLHQMLIEDLDSLEEAEMLLPIVQHINQLPTPPTVSTAKLIETLRPELRPTNAWQKISEWWPLLLMHSQMRVIGREIFLASAFVLAIGTIVTIFTYTSETIPLALLAPIVTAVGVGLLYDSELEQRLEIEDASPVSLSLLLLARLTMVFGFNLILGLVGSFVLVLSQSQVSLMPLILSWLMPMTFLSAFAFFLSVFSRNTLFSMTLSMFIWTMHLLLRTEKQELLYLLSLPGLADPSTRPILLSAALLMLVSAFWLAGQSERRFIERIT